MTIWLTKEARNMLYELQTASVKYGKRLSFGEIVEIGLKIQKKKKDAFRASQET